MTQQEQDEISWNPALRPEHASPAATNPTGGDASDLLTAGSAKEPHSADVESPLHDDDISAWDISDESNVTRPQEVEAQAHLANAQVTLDSPDNVDAPSNETINTQPSNQLPENASLPELTQSTIGDDQIGAQRPSAIENTSAEVSSEAVFEPDMGKQDFSNSSPQIETETQSQTNGLQASGAKAPSVVNSSASAVFESGEGQVDFADLLSSKDSEQNLSTGLETPSVEPAPVQREFESSDTPVDFAEVLSNDVKIAQPQSTEPDHLSAIQETPGNNEPKAELSFESSAQEEPTSQPTPNDSTPWGNETYGDVDSDGDDFFNQLKTQTKPIFAPPEAESRFEEGVPLLEETDPTSPDRISHQQQSTDDLFADEDEDTEGFFASTRKPETSEESPVHITRKSTAQVMDSVGFEIDSPASDISAAAQLDSVLKAASSEPQSQNGQAQLAESSDAELAARWEAELSDTGEDDLAARWEAALDDDDDNMLLDEDIAPSAAGHPQATNTGPAALNSPFQRPSNQTQPRPIPGVYTPHQPSTADLVGAPVPGAGPIGATISPYFAQQPSNPVATRGDSFAERSKQGYKSPYDLPDDLSRPRRPIATHKVAPPKVDNMMPPVPPSAGASQPPAPVASSVAGTVPPPAPKNFFEELPLPPPRSRPASSGRYTPPIAAVTTTVTGPSPAPPPKNLYAPTAPAVSPAADASSPQPSLKPPEPVDPYAPTLASSAPTGPSAASRYSPKPPGLQPSAKPPSLPRYSPAPPPSGPSARNRYVSQPLMVPGQANSLPFQPRTSSPLAYHEKVSYQPEPPESQPSLQASVDLSPPRAQRPSVDQGSPYAPQLPNGSPYGANQGGASPPVASQKTPPKNRYAPPEYLNEFAKRVAPSTTYTPAPQEFVAPAPPPGDARVAGPPRRSQTQSPGHQMTSPKGLEPPIEQFARPASVHGSGSPTKTTNPYAPMQPVGHNRAPSQQLDFIRPTDGMEEDPLARWKGAPIFKFGFGGAVVSCFPRHTPRYSAGQPAPMIMPTLGDPKFSLLNECLPSPDTIVQHPGPLKAKSKKKDLLSWLSAKIATFENDMPSWSDQSHPDTQKRHEEKTLLWKIVKILVENDGALEGSPGIQQSLCEIISPNLPSSGLDGPYGGASTTPQDGLRSFDLQAQPDATDPQWTEELRSNLLQGDREKVVWSAVDRRLWGHAMIIASTMDRSIWKQVVQEFVRREIRSTSGNTESLAALYEIFAGNIEESVDELVPPSARAGHHLISKADGQGTAKNALEGLESWRDTVGLVLSNRSSEDHQALLALGRLLASYGRIEAAHICFIFSRVAVFGGADDPQANIVLLGADHQRYNSALLDEDAILLTEVYEFATSTLSNTPNSTLPYLLAFKLLHAKQLADRGSKLEAQNYCDGVAAALKASTRPSPYHHQYLFAEVDELSARLRQTASDGGSWISKPSMEKVSGSMWARFNSFVAGDDSDAASTGSGKATEGAEVGPFANVAGTPTVSRSPSLSDLYGSYPGPTTQPIPAGASSRYHPSNQHTPNASPEQFRGRSSMDSQRSLSGGFSFNQRRGSQEPSPPVDSHMFHGAAMYGSPGTGGYQPTPPQSSYMPLAPVEEDASQSPVGTALPAGAPVNGLFYQPPGQDAALSGPSPLYQGPPGMPQSESPSSSYMPPAGGDSYEPSSYNAPVMDMAQQAQNSTEDDLQPRKKQFMDDDDDDDLAARAASVQRAQKAENDRKADEAFRKAAEEDAKKASQQPGKKGWFGGWFGGGGKKEPENPGGGPIKAKLGEENSFYYDQELKKWVNKKDPNSSAPVRATPPPPRGSAPSSRAASSSSMPPPAPPMSIPSSSRPQSSSSDVPPPLSSSPALSAPGAPPMGTSMPRSVSAALPTPPGSAPGPPRPTSTLTHASSIDDLLGAPQARKGNTVRGKKKGRYVDVMAQ
ncbi:hypothetical protein N7492_003398 [Penicillium capsulatum]|uniref:Protein transport protein sec16 n=1 Tax=Penicillium capsulatum TaxID=69766 RepID=A0A9W9LW71_9EURO|nr:hypothetical protein N7492_003398 [Penicillium capsulatum]KAJ6122019.1 hypothetical protein N7512_004484 [Penicillium capsulatum]